jgi:hypothetical protein
MPAELEDNRSNAACIKPENGVSVPDTDRNLSSNKEELPKNLPPSRNPVQPASVHVAEGPARKVSAVCVDARGSIFEQSLFL